MIAASVIGVLLLVFVLQNTDEADVEALRDPPQRLVIDTKFTGVFARGWYRDQTLRAGYVYQLYAYLRSQEGRGDPWADRADGLLLHPAINGHVDESVVIQGHRMRFATVDLAGNHGEIKQRLLQLIVSKQ